MNREVLFLILGCGVFILMFLNIVVCSYVAFFKLEEVEKHLENCKLVENNRIIWGGGFFGRTYRLAQIGGMLIFPKPIIKNNDASLEEIQNPPHLRRWIILPISTGMMLFAVMIILWVYGKCTGWIE